MASGADFDWTKPILIKPDFLRSLDELAARYGKRAAEKAVLAAGKNPQVVVSPEDADQLYAETNDYDYRALASDMRSLMEVKWSAHMSNDIRRTDLSIDQILGLTNTHGAWVSLVSVSSGSYKSSPSISIFNGKFRTSKVNISGDHEGVESYKNEIQSLLQSITRVWSPMVHPRTGFTVWLTSFVALSYPLCLMGYGLFPKQGMSPDAKGILAYFAFMVACALSAIALGFASRFWRQAFPLVEFEFGGGVSAAEVTRNLRKAIWSVPILIIGMPIITNLISSRISG